MTDKQKMAMMAKALFDIESIVDAEHNWDEAADAMDKIWSILQKQPLHSVVTEEVEGILS